MKIDKRKLDVALARKCWNQRDIWKSGEVSSQTMLNVSKGKEILPETAGKIARALGVDVTELLADS
ncbi:MAG: hypothetical protein SPG86_06130 [Gemmiger sp.]|uniref:hypothetical protein n=1 Tax=Gemmiger sp. TaxID=2049027 RepID=UPI002A91A245|nr:hypothetical protein [Gemmiger sp.]MDY5411143.1 hypothetical protein [Gemmiger sp.]